MKEFFILLLCLSALPVSAQVNYGEVRLKITGPSGSAMKASVELVSTGNGYDKSFATDEEGRITVKTVSIVLK
jgi:hypothetical protein